MMGQFLLVKDFEKRCIHHSHILEFKTEIIGGWMLIKEFIATIVNKCTHGTGEDPYTSLFRDGFSIFLSYTIKAFKILLVKFPNQ